MLSRTPRLPAGSRAPAPAPARSAASAVAAAGRAPPLLRFGAGRRGRAGQRSAADATTPTTPSDVRQKLRALVARLNASPNSADDPELRADIVELLPQLRAANPTPDPARSPRIDGVWVLLATVANAAQRETKRSPLQQALAAAYDWFFENVPLIAGSAVGRREAVGGGAAAAAATQVAAATGAKASVGSGVKKPTARGNFQTFDVSAGVVRNRAIFEALGRRGEINVDGTARVLSGDRLEATFLTADLRWGPLVIPFPIGAFKPTGWVDTLYLDDEIRVSTGDKGSVFVARKSGKEEGSERGGAGGNGGGGAED